MVRPNTTALGNITFKKHFKIISGATPKSERKEYWGGSICWITPADYKNDDHFISQGKRNLTQEGVDSCGTELLPVGSLIFSKRAPIGTVAISQIPLCTNQGCLGCIPYKNTYSNFYFYFCTAETKQFEVMGSGTTFMEISYTNFSNFLAVSPPLSEQQEIADFLDKKCSEIDSLIELKQQKIEELKEYKKSIIYEYVTGKKEVSA